MMRWRKAVLVWAGIVAVLAMTSSDRADTKPNLVIILVDDMGYGQTKESPRGVQYYFDGNTLQAVRFGPWKMAIGPQREQNRLEGQPQPVSKPPFPKLYNLETDIGETTDVVADHPDVVKQLQRFVKTMDVDLGISGKGPGVRPAGRVENPVPLLLKKQ